MEAKLFGLSLLFILIGYTLGNILFGLLISKIKKVDLRSKGSGNVGATNTSRVLGKKIGICVLIFDMFKGWLAIFISSIIYQTLGYMIVENQQIEYEKYAILIYISGLFTVIGHCFPIFYIFAIFKHKFDLTKAKSYSGGKGAASTAGVFAAISPWIFLIAFLIFMIIFFTFRYVSLSSIVAISTVCIFTLIPRLDYLYMLNILNINPVYGGYFNINEAYRIDDLIGYTYNKHWWYILTLFIISNAIGLIVFWKHKDNVKRLLTNTEKHLFEWKKENKNNN